MRATSHLLIQISATVALIRPHPLSIIQERYLPWTFRRARRFHSSGMIPGRVTLIERDCDSNSVPPLCLLMAFRALRRRSAVDADCFSLDFALLAVALGAPHPGMKTI